MSLESHFLSYKRWTSVSDNFHFVTSSVVICSSMGFQEDLMPSQSLRDKVHCCPPPADSWKPHIHSLRFVVFGFCRKVWWILYWSYSFNYSQALPFLFLVPPPILAAPPVLSKLFLIFSFYWKYKYLIQCILIAVSLSPSPNWTQSLPISPATQIYTFSFSPKKANRHLKNNNKRKWGKTKTKLSFSAQDSTQLLPNNVISF